MSVFFVGEEFREDGLDRSSIVARAFMLALCGIVTFDCNKHGRSDLSPAQVAEFVTSRRFFVILVDLARGDETPKIKAALDALDGQPFKYVLPLAEQVNAIKAGTLKAEDACGIEDAAVAFLEHWSASAKTEAAN